MLKVTHDWIHPDWPAPRNVRAITTTRGGGANKGPWSGFNLGIHCGDDSVHVLANRAVLNAKLPSPANWLHQVHGITVIRLPGDIKGEQEGDAAVSFQPGLVCAVLTADCLPVFFCNRKGNRVGMAHAGWRGLSEGILSATVAALEEDPVDLIAWMGPAIGPQVYEVGTDVADAFAEEFPIGFNRSGDRYLMDIYALARLKLAAAGVRSIHGGGFCTLSDSRRFFSYRRDGVTGRMASVIWFESAGDQGRR